MAPVPPRLPKVVLLCGGLGTRMREETEYRPKPMVEIGGKPMLWHIMKLFSAHGLSEFVCCLGYRGTMIKQYFLDYHALSADVTVSLGSGTVEYATRGIRVGHVHEPVSAINPPNRRSRRRYSAMALSSVAKLISRSYCA